MAIFSRSVAGRGMWATVCWLAVIASMLSAQVSASATEYRQYGMPSIFLILLVVCFVVAFYKTIKFAPSDPFRKGLFVMSIIVVLVSFVLLYSRVWNYALIASIVGLIVSIYSWHESSSDDNVSLCSVLAVWFVVLIGMPDRIFEGILPHARYTCYNRGFNDVSCDDNWTSAVLFFSIILIALNFVMLLMIATMSIRVLSSSGGSSASRTTHTTHTTVTTHRVTVEN